MECLRGTPNRRSASSPPLPLRQCQASSTPYTSSCQFVTHRCGWLEQSSALPRGAAAPSPCPPTPIAAAPQAAPAPAPPPPPPPPPRHQSPPSRCRGWRGSRPLPVPRGPQCTPSDCDFAPLPASRACPCHERASQAVRCAAAARVDRASRLCAQGREGTGRGWYGARSGGEARGGEARGRRREAGARAGRRGAGGGGGDVDVMPVHGGAP